MKTNICKSALFYTASAAAILLAGCSTLRSVDTSAGPDSARRGAYFRYAVARTLVKMDITADTGDSSSSAKASTATTAATDTGAATTPKPAAAATSPAKAAAPAAKAAAAGAAASPDAPAASADTSECADLTADYQTEQKEVAKAQETYADITFRLERASDPLGPRPTKADLADLAKTLAAYVEMIDDSAYGVRVRNADLSRQEIEKDCPVKVKVAFTPTIAPDNRRTFAARIRPNIFYDDNINLGVDASGFLTKGAPSSTSEIPGVLTALASDAGAFLPPGGGLAAPAPPPAAALFKGGAATICARFKEEDIHALTARLGDKNTSGEDVICVASAILGALDGPKGPYGPGALQALPPAGLLPVSYVATLEEMQALSDGLNRPTKDADGRAPAVLSEPPTSIRGRLQSTYQNGLSGRLRLLNVNVIFDCSQAAGEDDSKPPTGLPEGVEASADHVYDGLVVSASRVCRATAVQFQRGATAEGVETPAKATALPVQLTDISFWAQDSRYLTLLPTKRGVLVPRAVDYEFKGGVPTGVTDSRPSEAKAAVSLPGNIVGALIGGVTSNMPTVGTGGSTATGASQTQSPNQ